MNLPSLSLALLLSLSFLVHLQSSLFFHTIVSTVIAFVVTWGWQLAHCTHLFHKSNLHFPVKTRHRSSIKTKKSNVQ